jgi:lipopolysaccharide/colanic/teichoic acid biosynthesis glycosyltransferase
MDVRAEIARLSSPEPVSLPWPKRAFDKAFAALALLVTLPVSLGIAAAILLEGLARRPHAGPVFHRETRVSEGKPFRFLKFRIFTARAAAEIERGAMPKRVENDPRNLTGVGRLLKKTGLDELPQLWHVLEGHMSLVGPRPAPLAEYEKEVAAGIFRRKAIRAGLSGPAQLMKGSQRTRDGEILADLRYVDHFRHETPGKLLVRDLRLVRRTLGAMLKMAGE